MSVNLVFALNYLISDYYLCKIPCKQYDANHFFYDLYQKKRLCKA